MRKSNVCFLKFFVTLFFAALILTSCEKADDFSKIKRDYRYTGAFALPIGKSGLTLKKLGVNLPPLWETIPDSLVRLDSIQLNDTLLFSFSSFVDQSSKVKSLSIWFKISNEFPADASLYIYFVGNSKIITDTSTLIPISVREKRTSEPFAISIEKKQFDAWKDVSYIIIKGFIDNKIKHMSEYEFYKDYTLTVDLGCELDMEFYAKTNYPENY